MYYISNSIVTVTCNDTRDTAMPSVNFYRQQCDIFALKRAT